MDKDCTLVGALGSAPFAITDIKDATLSDWVGGYQPNPESVGEAFMIGTMSGGVVVFQLTNLNFPLAKGREIFVCEGPGQAQSVALLVEDSAE